MNHPFSEVFHVIDLSIGFRLHWLLVLIHSLSQFAASFSSFFFATRTLRALSIYRRSVDPMWCFCVFMKIDTQSISDIYREATRNQSLMLRASMANSKWNFNVNAFSSFMRCRRRSFYVYGQMSKIKTKTKNSLTNRSNGLTFYWVLWSCKNDGRLTVVKEKNEEKKGGNNTERHHTSINQMMYAMIARYIYLFYVFFPEKTV